MKTDIQKRIRQERSIVRRVVLDALHAGYALNVNNGGDSLELSEPTTKYSVIMAALFATDDETLCLYKDGKCKGGVYFVYGNSGWEVICDYHISLESVLAGANALAQRIEERAG